MFIKKYPAKIVKIVPISFNAEIADLKQSKKKAFLLYYKRTSALLQRIKGKNRKRVPGIQNIRLSTLKSVMLNTVLKAFVRSLLNKDVRRDLFKGLTISNRSLQGLYTLAEEARRSKIELQKLEAEEQKLAELQFYKNIIYKNIPPA